MSQQEAYQIQRYVDMARHLLDPLIKKADEHDREVFNKVGTALAAIDEVTGKEPT